MQTDDITYTLYILSTPEKIWDALTLPEYTIQYFFGRRVESDWKVGSEVRYWMEDGTLDVEGKVLEFKPCTKLVYTWNVRWLEEARSLPETIAHFEIEKFNDICRLTLRHESPHAPMIPKYKLAGESGWTAILNHLKTLIETGRPFPQTDWSKILVMPTDD